MISRAGLHAFSFCVLMTVVGSAQTARPPSATDGLGGFALPDEHAAHLLVLPDLAQPELLKTALCTGARRFPVEFERRQIAREDHNGRQTPHNFDNLGGSVFRIATGSADPGATCFLASDSWLSGVTFLRTTPPVGPGACVERGRFTTIRNRPVIHCWPIARLGSGKEVALLEFARRGKDALASLVFVDGARTMFADYPAEFRGAEEDLWRAGDDGVLSADGFDVVCALQRGAWYALGIAWSGSEGQSLSLWISEEGDRFTQVISDYWYQAPT